MGITQKTHTHTSLEKDTKTSATSLLLNCWPLSHSNSFLKRDWGIRTCLSEFSRIFFFSCCFIFWPRRRKATLIDDKKVLFFSFFLFFLFDRQTEEIRQLFMGYRIDNLLKSWRRYFCEMILLRFSLISWPLCWVLRRVSLIRNLCSSIRSIHSTSLIVVATQTWISVCGSKNSGFFLFLEENFNSSDGNQKSQLIYNDDESITRWLVHPLSKILVHFRGKCPCRFCVCVSMLLLWLGDCADVRRTKQTDKSKRKNKK